MANCQKDESQDQISDISIIKSKNEGSIEDNKENIVPPNTSAFNTAKTTPCMTKLL